VRRKPSLPLLTAVARALLSRHSTRGTQRMISQVVQDAIKNAIDTGDFSPLYDYFADDVELRIAMAVGSSISDERSKRSVIDCLQKLAEVDLPLDDQAPEFVANGKRIVAFWDESLPLRSGLAMRDQCTLVFDVNDGLITRLAIHHDLSPALTTKSEPRVGREALTAGPVVNGVQCSHPARQRFSRNPRVAPLTPMMGPHSLSVSNGEMAMRFMMMVTGGKDYEAGLPPKPELIAAIGKLSQDMAQAGVLLETGGLLPTSRGARVRVAGGRVFVTDGPFTETKEHIGGYAIVQTKSREEAVELGKEFMELHARVLGSSYDGECEVRQMFDAAECTPET
jgi:ketosteroid isomerase-like protein